MRRLVPALTLLLCTAAGADTPALPTVSLTYSVTWGGMSLGDAKVSLEPLGEPGCYRYESRSEPVGMVRMFYGAPTERSDFCVVDGQLRAQRFEFSNAADKDDDFALEFDWTGRKLRSSRGAAERELTDNTVDRFAIQQAVRLWVIAHLDDADPGSVEFVMVDDDATRTYRFAITGREAVRVPAGRFDTVLVERVDDPKKSSKFWLAPSRDYMPVKVEQTRSGRPQFKMALKS